MKTLTTLFALAILCATAYGQTIKALGYNTTNGEVVANTGTNTLAFTNEFINIDSTLRGYQTTNSTIVLNNGEFFGPWFFDEAVGFGDIGGTRANLELAEEDEVRFASVLVGSDSTNSVAIGISPSGISIEGATAGPNVFEIIGETLGAKIRADFGLGNGVITNIDVLVSGGGTNTLQFSNGILTNVTTP